MKQYQIIIFACILPFAGWSQSNYWQQEVNTTISARLDEVKKQITGFESIEYINNSPDTLNQIYIHIWPNAYRDQNTALARQLKEQTTAEENITINLKGWIDDLDFKQDGEKIKTVRQPNIDILLLKLNSPLLPGMKTVLSTPFTVQLPPYFSRSGYTKDQIIACQWYPKPAVYDKKGWHQFPYLDQGEFYGEFGSFDVTLDLPQEYVVGATGMLQNQEELDRYRIIGDSNFKHLNSPVILPYPSLQGRKQLQFKADSVHDFAWFAGKNIVIEHDTAVINNRTIDLFVFKRNKQDKSWSRAIEFGKGAIHYYSHRIGPYPYPVIQIVEGPSNYSSGGMEYPMITLITSPESTIPFLDGVITHEVGHNWFYGILATNERTHPWMDEGLNSYFQFWYEANKYRYNSYIGSLLPSNITDLQLDDFLDRIYGALNRLVAKQAIETSSENFSNKDAYGTVIYVKTAVWCYLLEKSLGKPVLDRAFKVYFERWKFKHPYPDDFKAIVEEVSGKNVDELFKLLKKRGNFR